MTSPSVRRTRRSTPWVLGCCGPMLTSISSVRTSNSMTVGSAESSGGIGALGSRLAYGVMVSFNPPEITESYHAAAPRHDRYPSATGRRFIREMGKGHRDYREAIGGPSAQDGQRFLRGEFEHREVGLE